MERFIAELTRCQSGLRAIIFTAVGNHNDASDILQQTNMVLWKNAESFRSDAEFMPWAVTIARYEVLSYYRDSSRDRHVFTEDVASLMLQTACEEVDDPEERRKALRKCVEGLPNKSREMICLRYENEKSIRQIAESLQRTENAVKCAFLRVRKTLEACVDRQLKAESNQ